MVKGKLALTAQTRPIARRGVPRRYESNQLCDNWLAGNDLDETRGLMRGICNGLLLSLLALVAAVGTILAN